MNDIDDCGEIYHYFSANGKSVDAEGNHIEVTEAQSSYHFSRYCLWVSPKSEKVLSTLDSTGHVWMDRLKQQDSNRYSEISLRYFKNDGDSWNGRSTAKIQQFLRDYFEYPSLVLLKAYKSSGSNGFPYWDYTYAYNQADVDAKKAKAQAEQSDSE